jgi:S1-C subfamily serine protease
MSLIPFFFQESIVAIGIPNGPNTHWIGTGFLYGKLTTSGIYNIFLVTNKHVFATNKIITVRFDNSNGGTLSFNIPIINQNGPIWTGHADTEVDVGVLPLNGHLLRQLGAKFNFFHSDKNILELTNPVAQHLLEGDGVFTLGFPLGLVDLNENIAITRAGCIARIRDCKANRSKYFLIDSPVFPGNSGGPVISKPEVVAIQGTTAIGSAYLIGIVASYIPYKDTAVSRQTGKERITFEENSGLTLTFPVDTIEAVINQIIQTANATLANPETTATE